jgi:hypothetical protein
MERQPLIILIRIRYQSDNTSGSRNGIDDSLRRARRGTGCVLSYRESGPAIAGYYGSVFDEKWKFRLVMTG